MIELAGSVEARMIIVDEKGGGNYTKLGDAFMYGTSDGDTVVVRAGNYTIWSINFFNNNISLIGESSETTNITFTSRSGISFYSSNGTSISNLTLHYQPEDDDANSYNMLLQLYIINSNNVSIQNCSISNAEIMITGDSENIGITNTDLIDCQFRISNAISEDPNYRLIRFSNTTGNGYPIHHLSNVHDQEFSGRSGGYFIEGCTNLTLSNVELGNGSIGFTILHSQNMILEGSSLSSERIPLSVFHSSNINIHSNIFGKGYIVINNITNCMIKDNSLESNVFISMADRCSFVDNQIESHGFFYFYQCENLTIRNNSFERDGISLTLDSGEFSAFDPETVVVENNYVNGKPIYYYYNTSNIIVPADAGQVIIVNCSDMTISRANITSTYSGIAVIGSSKISVLNSSILDSELPFQVLESEDILIENCVFENSSHYRGISFTFTNRSIIKDTQFLNARISIHGIGNEVMNCDLSSDSEYYWSGISTNGNCSISDCSISGFADGIEIRGDNVFIQSTAITNNSVGIDVGGNDCVIVNCLIYQNSKYGVDLSGHPDTNNSTVEARYNYWGTSNGPYHATKNPSGEGDEVSDGVDFSHWHDSRDFEPYDGDDEGNDNDPIVMGLMFLLMVLFGLIVILVIFVVRPSPGRKL